MTAYQITSMMEGVVQRGTATVVRSVGKPIAGKTGTTNDEKDVWFIGFSPDLAVGVYLGYDKPQARSAAARPAAVWRRRSSREFLKVALADKPAVPFRVPAGIKLIRVDAKTGMRVGSGRGGRVILEAFKPGTAPPDSYSVIGSSDQAAARMPATSARRRTPTARRAAAPGCTEPGQRTLSLIAPHARLAVAGCRSARCMRCRNRYIARNRHRTSTDRSCAQKPKSWSKTSSGRLDC